MLSFVLPVARVLVFHLTADDDGVCNAENLVYNSLPSSIVEIPIDQEITGVVACNEFHYYLLEVDNPCAGINLLLNGTANISATSVPELSVGKWPNLRPTFDNLQWTSYDWGYQNLTLDVWDPNFDGGVSCGPTGNDPCALVIGVFGYCASDLNPVPYTLRATSIPLTTSNIYQVPQLNQQVGAHSSRSYGICVADDVNVTAQLVSWDAGCDCPNNYVHLQMVLSRTNAAAVSSDLAWTVDHDDAVTSIDILTSDPASRPGTYYLNVYGWCTEDAQCTDPCSCAPCSNLATSAYALLVTNNSAMVSNITANRLSYLGEDTCQDAEADSVCAESTVCAYVKGTKNHRDTLSTGDKVGISIGAIVFFAIVVLIVLYFTGYLIYRHSGYGIAKDGEDIHLSSHVEDEVGNQLEMKMVSV